MLQSWQGAAVDAALRIQRDQGEVEGADRQTEWNDPQVSGCLEASLYLVSISSLFSINCFSLNFTIRFQS